MSRHDIMMIIGCVLPLLLIFVLPLFGVSGGMMLLIFIIVMFGCHLFMMRGHGGTHNEHERKKEADHGTH